MRGWGQAPRPDATLLTVRSFDPLTSSYRYQVNERFGQTALATSAFRPPFLLTVQARLAIGPDPVRDRLPQAFSTGSGSAEMDARIAGFLPNPVDSVLARRDSLALSPAQLTHLTVIRDSLALAHRVLGDSLRGVLGRMGSSPDPRDAFTSVQPLLQQSRALHTAAMERVRTTLSPEQWALIPETVKRPPRGGLGGAGGPGGNGRGAGGGRPPAW